MTVHITEPFLQPRKLEISVLSEAVTEPFVLKVQYLQLWLLTVTSTVHTTLLCLKSFSAGRLFHLAQFSHNIKLSPWTTVLPETSGTPRGSVCVVVWQSLSCVCVLWSWGNLCCYGSLFMWVNMRESEGGTMGIHSGTVAARQIRRRGSLAAFSPLLACAFCCGSNYMQLRAEGVSSLSDLEDSHCSTYSWNRTSVLRHGAGDWSR